MTTDISRTPPRSILFVPGSRPELALKAAAGDVDAVCIDLEDGVTASARPQARTNLAGMAADLEAAGKPVLVRINAGPTDYEKDIDALPATTAAVVLAKARGEEHGERVHRMMQRRGLGRAGLLPMIEDVAGIDAFAALRDGELTGLAGITVGVEDLAAELQCDADGRAMEHAFYRLLECARRLDVPLFGYPGSIAEFTDLDRYREQVCGGRDLGAVGAFCIHPRQVGVCNEVFRPGDDEVAWAREVVAAFEDAGLRGQGAVAVRGRMVDRPVAARARRIIARAEAVGA